MPGTKWRTREVAGKQGVCCLWRPAIHRGGASPSLYTGRPLSEDLAAEEGGLQGHRLVDNPPTGHCALHPFSHPSILPIVQKTKPRLRGAKQIVLDTGRGAKIGNQRDLKLAAACHFCATAKRHWKTPVSTSCYPIFLAGPETVATPFQ